MADGFFRSKNGYTVVQNNIIMNPEVSLSAKGLYLLIQKYITMPDKRYKKEHFENKCREGKKAFNRAWDELKDAGYLKVHMQAVGHRNWNVEYELCDEAIAGAHTFYYNGKGELTKTNIDRAAAKADKMSENETTLQTGPAEQSKIKKPEAVETGEGLRYPLLGTYVKGSFVEGSYVEGTNNNKSFFINPDTNNNNSIYPSNMSSQEKKTMDEIDETKQYMQLIRENINYDIMMSRPETDKERFDEIYNIMCDIVCVKRDYIVIKGVKYPYELMKSRMLKINSMHVEYVIDSIGKEKGEIGNIKNYIIMSLYNSLDTMNNYYAQKVNRDLYGKQEE